MKGVIPSDPVSFSIHLGNSEDLFSERIKENSCLGATRHNCDLMCVGGGVGYEKEKIKVKYDLLSIETSSFPSPLSHQNANSQPTI